MTKAVVVRAFLRNEVEMLPGQEFECSDEEYVKLARLGFVGGYETKVVNVPPITKKKPSASSRPAPARRKKTQRKSKKPATKS